MPLFRCRGRIQAPDRDGSGLIGSDLAAMIELFKNFWARLCLGVFPVGFNEGYSEATEEAIQFLLRCARDNTLMVTSWDGFVIEGEANGRPFSIWGTNRYYAFAQDGRVGGYRWKYSRPSAWTMLKLKNVLMPAVGYIAQERKKRERERVRCLLDELQ